MSLTIANQSDVFKFALVLYDYLMQKGQTKEAYDLSLLVDSCYNNDRYALKAHLQAFIQIQEKVQALPLPYQHALEEAITYIAQELKVGKAKEVPKGCGAVADTGECRENTATAQEFQEFQEIELKLKVPNPQLGEMILQDPLIKELSRDFQLRVREYETTYYDTPSHLLINHQVCYRIRNFAGMYIAAIKGFGSSRKGLSIRSEWNRQLPENAPTLEPFLDLAIGRELESLIKDEELLPIFCTRFKRSTLDLIGQDGSRIELALDIGEIVAGSRRESICELELELKSGQVEDVVRLGEALSEAYRLTPEERSKYQRGLMLAGLMSSEI
ncbi:adenylate cyclase [Desulfitobacterium hafniense DP7]|uniref:Adenylate cyclase n=1 Tax=Desulfitobacterium hafniense DP7 TaxID=537010 RepID=G9XV71_DESHA|nr:CYTH domain-containing protein [Desulfitobacterium hafniense]EHL04374.1 adenylate cyclase [Desulfitobacterium hafniense DP7]